jgi:hypothetical protein
VGLLLGAVPTPCPHPHLCPYPLPHHPPRHLPASPPPRGYPDWETAVKGWYDEVQYVDWSDLGWRPSTGHFTQLVWVGTTAVGCAINLACAQATYICQYAPAGNVLGQDWYLHVRPAGAAPGGGSAGGGGGSAPPAAPPPAPPPRYGGGSGGGGSAGPGDIVDSGAGAGGDGAGGGSGGGGSGGAAPPGLPADLAAVLARHNERRAKHGAPPMVWDADLDSQAQAYAATCPSGHSHAAGQGENLAWGHASLVAAADAWYDEVASYDYGNPTFSGSTGHFTQMVWKASTRLGCGSNGGCGMKTYVCRYAPAGNVIGQFADQVGRPARR